MATGAGSVALEVSQLMAVLEHAADGMVLVDRGGDIVFATQRVGALLGYNPVELFGQPLETLLPPELRAAHEVHRQRFSHAARSREMGSGLELEAYCRDGSRVPVDVSLAPLAGGLVVAAVRDRRASRAAAARLAAERAEHQRVADRELTARALHDIVVQRLFGVAATLMGQAAVAPPSIAGRLTTCVDQLDHTIELIRDQVLSGTPSADLAQRQHTLLAPAPAASGRGATPGEDGLAC
jgi:PAS domain S-box-containing protein